MRRGSHAGSGARGAGLDFAPWATSSPVPTGLMFLSALGLGHGSLSGLVALMRLRLFRLFAEVASFGRWSAALVAPTRPGWISGGHLAAGGWAVGLLAKDGRKLIRPMESPQPSTASWSTKAGWSRAWRREADCLGHHHRHRGSLGAERSIFMTGGAAAPRMGQVG